ncbi:uncharacterized protein ARMOST_09572 [Armillaria ostoyae]|uniref:ATP-dependent DNA helicase n=1 Tax=Armillaria ostoyae TaxID=47428 RepID=A0A284RBU8_ARMOS|nr:uncharacterized protein ARMOST_09572 [Armillaria ostoyae]
MLKATQRKGRGRDPPPIDPRSTLNNFFPTVIEVSNHTLDTSQSAFITRVALSSEQTDVLNMVVREGKSIFFTGATGTGKSLLLKAIIQALKSKYSKEPMAIGVTASTGMAASNIGGHTIHSWGGINPMKDDLEGIVKSVRTNKPAAKRWHLARVLIIDKISMVDSVLFNCLSAVAQALRRQKQLLFGGLQLIVTGDFFQLPPVSKHGQEPLFAFESQAWQKIEHCVELRQVFQQKDTAFVEALNSLHQGNPTPEAIALFSSLSRPLSVSLPGAVGKTSNTIVPTKLYPHRTAVQRANAKHLQALRSAPIEFIATDSGTRTSMLDALLAEASLTLKLGAQVMLIKNVDEVLVNGLVGKVIGFYQAWELSTQSDGTSGCILRHVLLDETHHAVLLESAEWNGRQKDLDRYPLVLFEYSNPRKGANTIVEAVLIHREEFRIEDPEGKLLARRVQLPLILAWAMSIHKSQGQTLHHVRVNLADVFEREQSYVALSRASSISGLEVINFRADKVMAHAKVIEWNKTLQSVQQVYNPTSELNVST